VLLAQIATNPVKYRRLMLYGMALTGASVDRPEPYPPGLPRPPA